MREWFIQLFYNIQYGSYEERVKLRDKIIEFYNETYLNEGKDDGPLEAHHFTIKEQS